MDIKEEVRRRIVDLTRQAYERGYREGVQSALAEIECIATDDVVEQLGSLKVPLNILRKPKASKKRATKERRSAKAMERPTTSGNKPKTVVVQEALRTLLTTKGEARRDEVLIAAQEENSKITKFDVSNGLRALMKQSKVRVSAEDNKILLPA